MKHPVLIQFQYQNGVFSYAWKFTLKQERTKQMKKLKIAVFFGGCSSEYSVSLASASAVISNLDTTKYEPIPIGISREGTWYSYCGDVARIKNDTWHNSQDCIPAVLSPDRREHKLLLLKETGMEVLPIDVAFPVLHGKNGEDGTLQGAIDLAGIPLAGCGVLASALCMDKDRAHRLAGLMGIRIPNAMVMERILRNKP